MPEMHYLSPKDLSMIQRLLDMFKSFLIGRGSSSLEDVISHAPEVYLAKFPEGTNYIPECSGSVPGKVECLIYSVEMDDVTNDNRTVTAITEPGGSGARLYVYNYTPVIYIAMDYFLIQRTKSGAYVPAEPMGLFYAVATDDIPTSGTTGTARVWDGTFNNEIDDFDVELISHVGEVKATKKLTFGRVGNELGVINGEC